MSSVPTQRQLSVGLAHAFGGALLFALPLFMTMEMWFLGLYLDRARIGLFTLAALGLLVGLAHVVGFKRDEGGGWSAAVVDAGIAYLVGVVTAAAVLRLLSVIGADQSMTVNGSIIALEAVPCAVGAAFARGTLGGGLKTDRERYGGEVFLMVAGAVVFAFNLAPTEEMLLIAVRMPYPETAALVVVSVAMLHALVYTLGFPGSSETGDHPVREFLRYTVVGYVAVLAASGYLLWTFDRFDAISPLVALSETAVLGLPAALGAGAARLIL